MNINKEQLEKLNYEQNSIIDANVSKMVVSAGPGSGKTYTIVKKVMKELEKLDEAEGVIVCSFTKEASKQLKDKLENKGEIKGTFIGTIDSFVFQEIIDAFKNRFLHQNNYCSSIDKLKVRMPQRNTISNRLTRIGINNDTNADIISYSKMWLDNFKKGIYEISFPTYLIAKKMLNEMNELVEYLSSKYKSIYIDEAQDLNEFQHLFLKVLIEKCNLNSILIGDKNQSIYEFRGARPEQFYNLKSIGYDQYRITVSVRCHQSILDYSNLIIDSSSNYISSDDCRVMLEKPPILENIETLNGNFMILFESNDNALKCYEYFDDKSNIDVIYTKKIELTDADFSDDFLELIEECIKFRVNINNFNAKLTYSSDDFELFLSNFYVINSKIRNAIYKIDLDIIEYVVNIFKVLHINIPEKVKIELEHQMSNNIYLNHYKNFENINRILTIHSSKGLESENVFVRLEFCQYQVTEEYRRKLFVAFSRAKNNLYISYKDKNIYNSMTHTLLLHNLALLNNSVD